MGLGFWETYIGQSCNYYKTASMERILASSPSITQKEFDFVNDALAHAWGENAYSYNGGSWIPILV
jgi:hypothetical protein